MTTFILGSKREPVFPNITPSNVIVINGALFEIDKYLKLEKKISGVLSPHIFVKDTNALNKIYPHTDLDFFNRIKKNINEVKFDNVFIRPTSDSNVNSFVSNKSKFIILYYI